MLVTAIDDQSRVCFQRMRVLETALSVLCHMQANGDGDLADKMKREALREAAAFVVHNDEMDVAAIAAGGGE